MATVRVEMVAGGCSYSTSTPGEGDLEDIIRLSRNYETSREEEKGKSVSETRQPQSRFELEPQDCLDANLHGNVPQSRSRHEAL
jgi:hypothetical protein